jgi:hypothetical protein
MAKDPAIVAHQEWIGYVQPIGLVVSIPALIDASAFLNRNYGPDHQRFLSALPQDSDGEPIPEITDFVGFARDVLGWDTELMLGAPGSDPVPSELEAVLENYSETLRPTYGLRNLSSDNKWLLLVEVVPTGTDLDLAYAPHDRGWQASPQARFERLLRQTGVSTGLLVNGRQIRLVYAPEKELSGHITFKLSEMVRVAGRPIFAALLMLLSSERLYSVADKERLPAILANSRKYQNVVSTQLASQVLEALYELLRGFQAANDRLNGELLRDVLARDPNHVYGGLLTTLLRLVFVLYAEDRGLLSTDPIYSNHYSVTGLYERLRADAGRYNDTMDQRLGAWAQLLALFRLIYSGGSHGAMKIPAREGYLFDHDRYLFLEGRHDRNDKPEIPQVPDGVVYRVLSKLLLLDGERLSYRTLAVEQIGSVYEAIMGFELQVASGSSIAIRPAKTHGAPATVNLEELLRTSADKRMKLFAETTDQKLTGQAAEGLKTATTIEELLVALDRKIAKTVTPNVVPQGAMIFQPSNERRKSGSHYTPSSLTGPIVEAALAPVLKQLGDDPKPDQILSLKVCDPAMGSGAFLVEVCRQLGDGLMKAWHAHNDIPALPPDEEEILHAQRMVAQRCLYGLDKNVLAVDLAKLSLWLATLAKDHPFTFLDHSLRHGDSLTGLTRQQIAAFHWAPSEQLSFLEEQILKRIDKVSKFRQKILAARDDVPYAQLRQELDSADDALSLLRMSGDAAISAFFSEAKPKQREDVRRRLRDQLSSDIRQHGFVPVDGVIDKAVAELHRGPRGIVPFHWELEFPEVFTTDEKGRVNGGFDSIVGNPPFAGKNTYIGVHPTNYLDWLKQLHDGAHGNADLVAHFFRRSFNLLRNEGCFGLIATNTIGQGDTRSTGLRWICVNGGQIYRAVKRLKWPGEAAVVVSVVHVCKGVASETPCLNGHFVLRITAYLFHAGGNENPYTLRTNENLSFTGAFVLGMGFTFDDDDTSGVASPISEMNRLIAKDPRNADRIFPYIGGEEINSSPTHAHRRYVINFEDFPLRREELGNSWAKAAEKQRTDWLKSYVVPTDYPLPVASDWPDLLSIIEQKVRPERLKQASIVNPARWWMFARSSADMKKATANLDHILVHPFTSSNVAFAFIPARITVGAPHVVFAIQEFNRFAVLQSRVHEVWARFMASSMKDDLRYTASDCFETFPFPSENPVAAALEVVGRNYYDFRAELMVSRDEGLTETYTHFNDPNDDYVEIQNLRELHRKMDEIVLDAYGWSDIQPKSGFAPEFEDEEEEDDNGRSRKKKYRYRWPDEIRDQVLARLLELNRQRALEEGQPAIGEPDGSAASNGNVKTARKTTKQTKPKDTSTQLMFATGEGEA